MNYYIFSDIKSENNIAFPEKLSQFFEHYYAFGEESEVAQISELLDVDLAIFQKYNNPADKDVIWLDINDLVETTHKLIDRLRSRSGYFRQIRFGGIPGDVFRNEFLKATADKDQVKINELVRRWQNTPDSAFPPDTGYLSSNLIMMDLLRLDKILLQIKESGGKKINLVYK